MLCEFPPPPESVVAIETRLGSPLRELRIEWDFVRPIVHTTAGLAEAGPLFEFHLRHTSGTEALYLVIRNQGSLLRLTCMLNQCQTRHDFPISVIFLLRYHPFLILVANKITSEKQK